MTLSDYINAPLEVRMRYYEYLEIIYLMESHRMARRRM